HPGTAYECGRSFGGAGANGARVSHALPVETDLGLDHVSNREPPAQQLHPSGVSTRAGGHAAEHADVGAEAAPAESGQALTLELHRSDQAQRPGQGPAVAQSDFHLGVGKVGTSQGVSVVAAIVAVDVEVSHRK